MKAEYCVDYLSYKWKTDDLIETYRETRKHSIVNKLKQDKHEESCNWSNKSGIFKKHYFNPFNKWLIYQQYFFSATGEQCHLIGT